MPTILVTGGTGFVGKHLIELLLSKGYNVIVATRQKNVKISNPQIKYAFWDIEQQYIDAFAITDADAIIHLAGAGVADKRWTSARKKEIADSRIKSSQLLVTYLNKVPHRVQTVISASAIGLYGPDLPNNANGFAESAEPYNDFLATTCVEWEKSIAGVGALGIRLIKLRTGIVLQKGGGALKEFMQPLMFGIAPILGSGNQVISWIGMQDLCRMYLYALENTSVVGNFNAVAPNPVTNKSFMLKLAAKMKGRLFIAVHVPAFVLKLILGEMSIEVLKSATVNANKIQQQGFRFLHSDVDSFIEDVFR